MNPKKKYLTKQLKTILRDDDISAHYLLIQQFPTIERKFNKLTKQLADLLIEVREVFPDAEYYTASGGFNLLIGESHSDDRHARSNPEMVALTALHLNVTDGDF